MGILTRQPHECHRGLAAVKGRCSTHPGPPSERVISAAPGHALGMRGNILVFMRTVVMSAELAAEVERACRLWDATIPGKTPRGVLVVLGAAAPVMSGEVAAAQREALTRLTGLENVSLVTVLEGHGIALAARRAFYRILLRGKCRLLTDDVAHGLQWLTTSLGVPSELAPLGSFVDSLRRIGEPVSARAGADDHLRGAKIVKEKS